ncbi:hypothetical protein L2747_11720 [Shewanella marinintestina]|uniref:hypothetical protein n=1 Tax=Shewanella marinintestina TaxID=190305 RepID=UPI00200BEC4F|nr:hypothetical protein [Shewanella marinintestina]MCL1146666.1 hypothetical protein [Shewanella marinintestina]
MDQAIAILMLIAVCYLYNELRSTRSKPSIVERKLDCVLEDKGILFDKKTFVAKEVLSMLQPGKRLKACTNMSLKQV